MLLVLFACLFLAALILAFEVARGQSPEEGRALAWGKGAVFALAASAGGTLLVALPLAEWLLILALLPLTVIALLRFATLLTRRIAGWQGIALAGLVVVAGVAVGVQSVPVPLTRSHIQATMPGAPAPSANPDAGRLVRT